MDPVTALGAAAAGAQFVGIAVKCLLGSAKLIQDIRDEPKRAIELLTWVEDEVTSMQTLLHPESVVFSHLTTNQYLQIAPCAIKARKAMDKVNNVLSPLVRDIDSLKSRDDVGKRIMLVWKSILNLKSMKSIETDLGIIRLLNATLLRELQVCGLETQSLLRNQSTQVLSIVSDFSKRDEELRQAMEQINASTANLAQTVVTIKDVGDVQHRELLRMHMMQMSYLQAIQDMLRMEKVQPRVDREANRGSCTESEASAVDVVKFHAATAGKGSGFLRCRCRSNLVSTTRKFGAFAYKISQQASQVCPLHGRIGQKIYSIEANLNPWAFGLLQFSLGMLFQGKTWSILPPLRFQGVVKRSESPIFRLIDEFISSCSTMEKSNGQERQRVRLLLEDSTGVRLAWDSQRTKNGLAGVFHGIQEAAATGLASYSDMDEQGCTLLTDLCLLFAFLGEELFNVETELLRLFQLAFNSNLDPTVPFSKIHDLRDYKVYLWRDPRLKMADILVNYAIQRGTISTPFYNAFLDYEGLAESTGHHMNSYHWSSHFRKAILSDPLLADALGYCDLSLAIISRSLEQLHKYLCSDTGYHSSMEGKFSPLELAVGWPEGMQVLIDHDYDHVSSAIDKACRIHDVQSARLLLSTEAAIPFDPAALSMAPFYQYSCRFRFTEALFIAIDNVTIFRLAAEELWSRRDTLITTLLDYLRLEHRPDLLQTILVPTTTPAVRDHLEMPNPSGNIQDMAEILSSAVHVNNCFGSRHHQILFDIGFTDIDIWCGSKGTPLGLHCQNVPGFPLPSRVTKEWCSSILWFLKAGANPRLDVEYLRHNRYGGRYVQYFLAAAQNLGVKLDKKFVPTLGRCDERYLHDSCSCWCSSKGCIPSSGLWRSRLWTRFSGPSIGRQPWALSVNSTRKWTRYWGYSKREKEFIYQEAVRHELFQRLGTTHLCCIRTVRTRDIPHVEQEDGESRLSLEYLLHLYSLIRKVYAKMSIESFCTQWWDNLDTVLPPTADLPSAREMIRMTDEDLWICIKDLEDARDGRWREALEGAGYKDWDYQDVIRDHCTKMLLKARAYKEKEIAWKRHRLVTRPRFIRKRPFKSSNVQSEEEWSS